MLKDIIQNDLRTAMKAGDSLTLSTLRMVVAAIQNKEIELKPSNKKIIEDDIIAILKKEVKKRREAANLYLKGGRNDLADNESKEAKIIERYLPQPMSEIEVSKIIDTVISKTDNKNFGLLMKAIMAELKGKADASLIGQILKKRLS